MCEHTFKAPAPATRLGMLIVHSFLLAALLLAQEGGTAHRAGFAVGDVLDRWEGGSDLVESYDLSLVLKSKLLLDTTNRPLSEADAISFPPPSSSRICRKRGKRRGEFTPDQHGHFPPPMIWDGKLGYQFAADGRSVTVAPYIIFFGGTQYEDYEACYRTINGTNDRIALARARPSKLLQRDGRLFVVDVPAVNAGAFNNVHFRVWLDPDRNFMVAKLSDWAAVGGREQLSLELQNDLREVSGGVWAPARSTRRIYFVGQNSDLVGKCIGTSELSLVEDKSKFNIELSDELFEVRIPNGMTVVDKVRNAVYIQGSNDPDKYLSALADSESAKRTRPRPGSASPGDLKFIPKADSGRWLWALLIVGSASALLGCGAALRRRVNRDRRKC